MISFLIKIHVLKPRWRSLRTAVLQNATLTTQKKGGGITWLRIKMIMMYLCRTFHSYLIQALKSAFSLPSPGLSLSPSKLSPSLGFQAKCYVL